MSGARGNLARSGAARVGAAAWWLGSAIVALWPIWYGCLLLDARARGTLRLEDGEFLANQWPGGWRWAGFIHPPAYSAWLDVSRDLAASLGRDHEEGIILGGSLLRAAAVLMLLFGLRGSRRAARGGAAAALWAGAMLAFSPQGLRPFEHYPLAVLGMSALVLGLLRMGEWGRSDPIMCQVREGVRAVVDSRASGTGGATDRSQTPSTLHRSARKPGSLDPSVQQLPKPSIGARSIRRLLAKCQVASLDPLLLLLAVETHLSAWFAILGAAPVLFVLGASAAVRRRIAGAFAAVAALFLLSGIPGLFRKLGESASTWFDRGSELSVEWIDPWLFLGALPFLLPRLARRDPAGAALAAGSVTLAAVTWAFQASRIVSDHPWPWGAHHFELVEPPLLAAAALAAPALRDWLHTRGVPAAAARLLPAALLTLLLVSQVSYLLRGLAFVGVSADAIAHP
jgi:hypothetical protein